MATAKRQSDWRTLSEDFLVRFSYPCEGDYSVIRRQRNLCQTKDHTHGHLVLCSDGLVGTVPFPISSQAGLTALLAMLVGKNVLSPAEVKGIKARKLASQLPKDLSAEESDILGDETKSAEAISFSYVGP